jgi:hypothetical protein
MRETINIIAILIFKGIQNPPPTGVELVLTAFVRILIIGFLIGVSIREILQADSYLLILSVLFNLCFSVPILYAMLEGQFALIHECRGKDDPISKSIVFGSIYVFSALAVAILWTITIIR